MALQLRNPHSVLAALETRPGDVKAITAPQKGGSGHAWDRVLQLAKERKVPMTHGMPKGRNPEGGREGVGEASVLERAGISAEELFARASERSGGKGLWLALDSLQDPHNVGAIFRTAAFFGIEGILLTEERSAPLSATAYDVAAGGLERVPFTLQTNLKSGMEIAKEAGLWILGTSEHANDDFSTIPRDRPWLLVLGNEERGMRRLTEENCDLLCRIAPRGKVTSLNVSVAAGILISALSPSGS